MTMKMMLGTATALLLAFAIGGCEDKPADGAKATSSAAKTATAAETATAAKTAAPKKAGGVDCDKFLAKFVEVSGRAAPSDKDKKDFGEMCATYNKQKPEAFKKCFDCIAAGKKKEDIGACQKPKAACDGFDM